TNQELETMVDTSDEWITTRTGIKERRILKGGRATSDMGVAAVKGLHEKRGIQPEEIDLLICATVTPDMPFPATANIISDKVGAKNAWGDDLNAACSGFILALATGAQYIESAMHVKVVVVGVEMMSPMINYKARTTCILCGDGACAVLLEGNHERLGVMDSILRSNGSGRHYL